MPTPTGPIINAAETLADAFIVTGTFYDQVSLFVAFAIGLVLVGVVIRLAKRTIRR